MIWLLFVLIAVSFRTFWHILNKRILGNVDPIVLSTAVSLIVTIFYTPIFIALFIMNPVIATSSAAYPATVISGLLNALAIIILFTAIKFGDVSVVVPLRSLVPIFTMIWAIIFLNEIVTFQLLFATVLVVIGSVVLHLKGIVNKDVCNKASILALMTAFIYSFTLIADKIGTTYIDPLKYTYLIYSIMAASLLCYFLVKGKLGEITGFLKENWKDSLFLSFFMAAGSMFTFIAISMAPVTIVAPIFRIELILSVIAGGLFLKEKNIRMKLIGAFLIFIGIIIILVF